MIEFQDTHFQIHPDALFTQVEDQVVILQYDRGIYYALNEVGVRVWQLLEQGKTPREIQRSLLGEYNVSEERLAGDVAKLIGELRQEGLIR